MKTVYIQAEADGRIVSLTDEDYGFDGYQAVEVEDDFDVLTIDDYRLQDGKLVYTGEGTAAREEAEKQAQAAAEEREKLDSASREYFLGGGKESMEQDIRDAAASGGGADPQVAVMARLIATSIDFATVTATDVAAIPDYVPEWSTLIGQKLKQNSPCVYKGTIYRASQDVTVQDIYPPDVAGESQYYPIEVAPDGVIVYRTCHGQYDMVHKGERRHYPGADGPVYEALEDTAYSPDTYPQHWRLVPDADTE